MPTESATICFAGTHDPAFGRNALVAEGLRRRGYAVSSCVEPAWGSTAQRVEAARRGLANGGLGWRLTRAYARVSRQLHAQPAAPTMLYLGYPGQLDAIVLRLLAPGARIVLDGFVSIDETLADRRIGSPRGATRRVARLVDRLAFHLADRVVVDTAAHLRRFAHDLGLDPARAVVVPVGARDPLEPPGRPPHPHLPPPGGKGLLSPRPARENEQATPSPPPFAGEGEGGGAVPLYARPHQLGARMLRFAQHDEQPPRLRVLYFGGFIPLHGVAVILEAARVLGPDADISFELVGDGQDADTAEQLLAHAPLPHVRLVRRWMPEERLIAEHIAPADVCLGIFGKAPKTMDVVPAKVYLAMACSSAVVTADTPAVREEILARTPGGGPPLITCPPGDAAALAAALVRLRDDPPLRARVAAAGRRLFESHFRPERIVEPLIPVIEDLLNPHDARRR